MTNTTVNESAEQVQDQVQVKNQVKDQDQVKDQVKVQASRKAVYSTPVLKVYGQLAELTLGGKGTKTDGLNSTKK